MTINPNGQSHKLETLQSAVWYKPFAYAPWQNKAQIIKQWLVTITYNCIIVWTLCAMVSYAGDIQINLQAASDGPVGHRMQPLGDDPPCKDNYIFLKTKLTLQNDVWRLQVAVVGCNYQFKGLCTIFKKFYRTHWKMAMKNLSMEHQRNISLQYYFSTLLCLLILTKKDKA